MPSKSLRAIKSLSFLFPAILTAGQASGASKTVPINQSLIQPGGQVIISQTVTGGTGGNGTSVQDWTESRAPYANGGYTRQILIAQTPSASSLPLFMAGMVGAGVFYRRKQCA